MREVIIGVSGVVLNDEERALLAEHKPHGVILFSRNCKAREQIIALNSEIKQISPNTLVFIDQEGGRVRRIKPPIAVKDYPNMEFFGKIYDTDKEAACVAVEQNFFELMSELITLGVDVTCAPVCDLRFEGAHDVVGDRSFGESVQKVVELSKAALDGIHRAGGEGVLKHIPGHGRAYADSHKDLPKVDAPLAELERTDFAVFKALAEYCKYAMTAHIVYSALDDKLPATLSAKVMQYIRDEIGFKGIVMTDALEMKALSGGMEYLAKTCFEAGCDIALCCTGYINDSTSVFVAQKS